MKYNYSQYKGFIDPAAPHDLLTDNQGRYRTESLFAETIQSKVAKKFAPLYSLTDKEKGDLPSAYWP